MKGRRGAGEGSVYQRASDGRWLAVLDLGWRDGKRRRTTVSAKTKTEVMQKLRKAQREADLGVHTDATTVEQWMTYWLDEIVAPKARDSTMASHRGKTAKWIVPHLGKHRLDQLRPEHVIALLREMEQQGKADATRRQVHAILRRALNVAVMHGRIAWNPAERVDAPKAGKVTHGALDLDEARRVLAVIDAGWPRGTRYAAALLAGLRQGEALGLRWEHVDFDTGMIHVVQAAQRVKGRGVVVTGLKSEGSEKDASRRLVPMLPVLARALNAERRPEGFVWGRHDGDAPFAPEEDWQSWKTLLAVAKVRPLPLHAARATTGSLLMAAGVPDVVIAEILGHAHVRVTREHYLHGDTRLRQEAMAALSRLVDGDGASQLGSGIMPVSTTRGKP